MDEMTVVKDCIFWDGCVNEANRQSLRTQIEAMDAVAQEYWRKELSWVFDATATPYNTWRAEAPMHMQAVVMRKAL